MSAEWLAVVGSGIAAVVLKSAGPVAVGGRRLGSRASGVVDLVGPAVLAALVVTQAVGGDREVVLDARLAGLAVAAVAIWRRAPLIVVVLAAALVAAVVRAL